MTDNYDGLKAYAHVYPNLQEKYLTIKEAHKTTLSGELEFFSKEQLDELLYGYTLDDITFGSKSEQVEYLAKTIVQNCVSFFFYEDKIFFEAMEDFLKARDDETAECEIDFQSTEGMAEMALLIMAMKTFVMTELMRKGILFHHIIDGRETFVIPKEVAGTIRGYIEEHGKGDIAVWGTFREFISNMVSRYGVLTPGDFKRLWDVAYPDRPLSTEQVRTHLRQCVGVMYGFQWNEKIDSVHDLMLAKATVTIIMRKRQRHSMYIPDGPEMRQWIDSYTPAPTSSILHRFECEQENPYYVKMEDFLQKAGEELFDEILTDIMFYMKMGANISDILEQLDEKYDFTGRLSEKKMNEFLVCYQGLNNSSQLWVSYGASPNKLSSSPKHDYRFFSSDGRTPTHIPDALVPAISSMIPKVGRNEPCPCGSGKKYKQCHGR